MKLLFLLLFALALLHGCAYYAVNLPNMGDGAQVRAIKDNDIERIRAGNILNVNRIAGAWRDVLVFDGYYNFDQLIVYGTDGLPALVVDLIGRFSVDPALGGNMSYGERLVSGFRPGQEYTLLIFTKSVFGNIIHEPQVYHGRAADRVIGQRYRYYVLGSPREDIVNDVVYLPDVYIPLRSNSININIDVNALLQRGIYRLRSRP